MIFNSFQFAVFFAVVYGLYRCLPHKGQNRLLLIASYMFYGAWDWRFLSLIWVSTILDYVCGLMVHQTTDTRIKKRYLWISLAGNLGILAFFKYFNFFASSAQDFCGLFGLTVNPFTLNVILPVGISFYTFQTMSYTLDIYRGQLAPTRRFWDFALFVAFFPQLVAGPIERARHLLPQILRPRVISRAFFFEGWYLIFWGLFQKIFIADNLARIVDPVFDGGEATGMQVLIALYAFAFQIYCDFAGYSNIARGLGRVMGFDIMVNFHLPYIAANPREFWRRWHISLSSFLRDYVYIPLGGNHHGSIRTGINLMATMLLGGLWHGAAWTFVLWGAWHGMLLFVYRAVEPIAARLIPKGKGWAVAGRVAAVVVFFHAVCLGWLLFRADSVGQALELLRALWAGNGPDTWAAVWAQAGMFVLFTGVLFVIECAQWWTKNSLIVLKWPVPVRALVYALCYYLVVIYGVEGGKAFIYFQF